VDESVILVKKLMFSRMSESTADEMEVNSSLGLLRFEVPPAALDCHFIPLLAHCSQGLRKMDPGWHSLVLGG